MYTEFFGFKERPFQLVPNPGYLFLSRSHEEAFAHLNYAVSHGDGFVEITGEVGTGKTTLCRVFLNDLEKNTEVAYIFNPRLDAVELMQAINAEFGIPAKAAKIKSLIDTLNTFLLKIKSQGKNAILLIDEAQNLDKDVLEQLRLLSNLETDTGKLLQIILVGQPELQKILDSHELRQLRQRITLRWRLTPLTAKETEAYIHHRVNIAAGENREIFAGAAYRRIYNYSGGIPRLINIACDRALLTAYGFNRPKVTAAIARDAIKELTSRGEPAPRFPGKRKLLAGLAVLLVLALVYVFRSELPFFGGNEAKAGTGQAGKKSPGGTGAAVKSAGTFAGFLADLTGRASRSAALKTVVSLWGEVPEADRFLADIDDDAAFFRMAAARANLQILEIERDMGLIEKLNLPVVLEFSAPGALSPRFLALVESGADGPVLGGGEAGKSVRLSGVELRTYWTGRAFLPWRDFYNCKGDIPIDAPKESVFALKMLLLEMGFKGIEPGYDYDAVTEETIKKIQEKHGIKVDGIVGPQTKIVIYNEKKGLKIPHIRPAAPAPTQGQQGKEEQEK